MFLGTTSETSALLPAPILILLGARVAGSPTVSWGGRGFLREFCWADNPNLGSTFPGLWMTLPANLHLFLDLGGFQFFDYHSLCFLESELSGVTESVTGCSPR